MKLIRVARFLIAPFLAAVMAACASEPLPTGNAAFAVDTGHEYKLGPGDKVRVTVFGEEALSGEFIVANNGAVAVPLIGEVTAGGLTPSAFQIAIQEKLTSSGMVKSPRVSTDVISYRPYYILGEVTKPGQYPYAVGLTMTKAVATAGGFTYRANHKVIYVTREGTTREVPISLTAASTVGPGDTIRVAERYF
jgi:protein involved in polysaccharide export with SLBB domain